MGVGARMSVRDAALVTGFGLRMDGSGTGVLSLFPRRFASMNRRSVILFSPPLTPRGSAVIGGLLLGWVNELVMRVAEREPKNWRCMCLLFAIALAALSGSVALRAQSESEHPFFEILTRRMDVDVDGAPNAYGPRGKQTLDNLKNAHYL